MLHLHTNKPVTDEVKSIEMVRKRLNVFVYSAKTAPIIDKYEKHVIESQNTIKIYRGWKQHLK